MEGESTFKTHPAGIEPASTTPRRGSPPWNIQVLITQSSLVVLRVQPSSYARRLDLCGYYGNRTRLIFWSDNPVATPSSPSIQKQRRTQMGTIHRPGR